MVQPAEDKRDLGLETWCRCVSTVLCSKNKASTCIYIDVDAVGTRGGRSGQSEELCWRTPGPRERLKDSLVCHRGSRAKAATQLKQKKQSLSRWDSCGQLAVSTAVLSTGYSRRC